jgi:hypothetical protein
LSERVAADLADKMYLAAAEGGFRSLIWSGAASGVKNCGTIDRLAGGGDMAAPYRHINVGAANDNYLRNPSWHIYPRKSFQGFSIWRRRLNANVFCEKAPDRHKLSET